LPAHNVKSICFTDQHDEVVNKIAAELQVSYSEAVRILIDKGLDNAPDVRLSVLLTRRNDLQASLEAVSAQIIHAERAISEHPLALLSPTKTIPDNGGSSDWVNPNKLKLKSGHDEFVHFLTRLGSGGALGRAGERVVRSHLHDHPEWFSEVPDEYKHLFDRSDSNGGTASVGAAHV